MALLPPSGPGETTVQIAGGDREDRLAEARNRGIELTSDEKSELVGRWVAQLERWGETFGFRLGMSPEELSEQALVALGLSAQEAIIARMEITGWTESIRSAYPIVQNTP